MSIIQDAIDVLAPLIQRIWPGLLCSGVLGYSAAMLLGYPGFLAGSAAGALVGTLLGDTLLKRRGGRATSIYDLKTALSALAAFAIVVVAAMFLQAIVIIAVVSALLAIGALWLAG